MDAPFAAHTDTLFYIHTNTYAYDFMAASDVGLLNVRKFGSSYVLPRTSTFSPVERTDIVAIASDGGLFQMTALLLGIVLLFSIDFEVRISLFFLILRSQLLTSSFGVTSSSPSAAYPTQS